MIPENDIYRFVGLAVVILLVVHFGIKMFRFQTKIVEGMVGGDSDDTPTEKVAEAVKNENNKLEDMMHIDKYRSSYEDIITELEQNCSEWILMGVGLNAAKIAVNPFTEENQKIINYLNGLAEFRKTLNTAMIVLDKKGSTSGTNGKSSSSMGGWFS